MSVFEHFTVEDYQLLFSGLAVVGTLALWYFSFLVQRRAAKLKELGLESLIESARATPTPEMSLVDYVASQLDGMVAREKLTMSRAESTRRQLAFIGSWLMVASVLAPIAARALYAWMEPLPRSTIDALIELKAKTGFTPTGDQIRIERDWHILIGGLSFGFLFLAAARGMLRFESRNRLAFFSLSQRVGYYERLAALLRINMKLAEESNEDVADVVRSIIALAEKPPALDLPDIDNDEQPSVLKEQVESVVSAFRKPG